MKSIFRMLLLMSSLTSFSQSKDVVGDYTCRVETVDNNLLEYKLTLNQDGTFVFHYYSNIELGGSQEVNKFGKGKWNVENKVVSFFSNKLTDIDEKHTLDFTHSKARFVIKSPRNKTDQIIKTKLMFLESEIFWMARIDLLKI